MGRAENKPSAAQTSPPKGLLHRKTTHQDRRRTGSMALPRSSRPGKPQNSPPKKNSRTQIPRRPLGGTSILPGPSQHEKNHPPNMETAQGQHPRNQHRHAALETKAGLSGNPRLRPSLASLDPNNYPSESLLRRLQRVFVLGVSTPCNRR